MDTCIPRNPDEADATGRRMRSDSQTGNRPLCFALSLWFDREPSEHIFDEALCLFVETLSALLTTIQVHT